MEPQKRCLHPTDCADEASPAQVETRDNAVQLLNAEANLDKNKFS